MQMMRIGETSNCLERERCDSMKWTGMEWELYDTGYTVAQPRVSFDGSWLLLLLLPLLRLLLLDVLIDGERMNIFD